MTTAQDVIDELSALEDPKARAVNERHGDDHGVNLTKLRGVAKRIGMNRELAGELWATDVTPARLVALLISRPKEYTVAQLDTMLRESRTPKTTDWLVNYIAKKSPLEPKLREAWFTDADTHVRAAGWALTTDRVIKKPAGPDLEGLLDQIEAEMVAAPGTLQWNMNETLANIGIYHPHLRERALDIGERLEVLKDYPTPPNCTSPFAPSWINEIVRRREGDK
ncbi:DNA alkylation repair protein [Microbacterium sp. YY-03]|uniref:DNA alkylation repair protein n=1 Tax=Microbacterium sp. YY-03 TaxID=3421636 RepID=UPI003D186BC9